VGTIKAVIVNWSQRASGKEARSGEKVDLDFLEDIEDAFLVNNLIGISTQSLNASADAYNLEVSKVRADFAKNAELGFFDSITASVNSVLAVVDTAEAYGNLFESKILAAAQLIYQADRRLRTLQDPANATLTMAVLQLWDALLTLFKDLQKTGGGLTMFTLQKTMSVIEISKALYDGDATKAGQLLQLNSILDPFSVSNGTTIRYYPIAA
jgi:hypothetical protein